jgi:hypothetical protein
MTTCFAKGRHRPCYGRPTVHHIVSQARLKREHASLSAAYRRGEGPRPWSLTKALKDEANLLSVCWGCHQCVEAGSIPVEPSDLPEGFWEFVSEYDLDGQLPLHLMEATAA